MGGRVDAEHGGSWRPAARAFGTGREAPHVYALTLASCACEEPYMSKITYEVVEHGGGRYLPGPSDTPFAYKKRTQPKQAELGICQTFAASPAEPGELPCWFSCALRQMVLM